MSTPVSPAALELAGQPLSPFEVESVARDHRPVTLGEPAVAALERANRALMLALDGEDPIYGVNTGFGSLARQRIEPDDLVDVQHNLIRSHAAGAGDPLGSDVTRAMLLLLASSLCRGRSGPRPVLVRRILDLLNHDITPIVPSLGSVGASGDLAPLAHAALALIGEGRVVHGGRETTAGEALAAAGLEPVSLGPKEGLALINGTHLMSAQAALLVVDLRRVFDAALSACAMSIDACRATDTFLDARAFEARQHPGPKRVAARLRELLVDSEIVASHVADDQRVQDPYSFRCAPLVLGAAADAFEDFQLAVERELSAVTDNPLILEAAEGGGAADIVSAGLFHGAPIAIPLDQVTIPIAHVANAAERRTFFLLAARDEEMQLRPHLSPEPGVQSGLMITQYTAAACCNEIISLAGSATAANIPTCAGIEDLNSYGPRAAAQARRALDLTMTVVAIEMLCAAQAIESHRPLRSGGGVEGVLATVRDAVPPLVRDRTPAPDIEAIRGLIRAGRF